MVFGGNYEEGTNIISDVIPSEYSSLLLFCSESGKVLISELTNIDFVAFRSIYGLSKEYVNAMIDISL